MLGRLRKWDWTLIFGCIIIFCVYVFIHHLGQESIWGKNSWDSYTLQALRWREGFLDLGENYTWLELAIFEGKYYLSFPPVPILPLYVLTFIFGENIPSNTVVLLYLIACFGILYRLFKSRSFSEYTSLFWALFLTLGSNLASICVYGGVWFQAQSMCFMFICLSLRAALRSRSLMAYIWLALAVGCRPFVIAFFPMLMVYFYSKQRGIGRVDWKRLILPLIAPALIGAAYMWYNYIRFGDVLEFGHNYLPEFLEAEYGQFHPSYLLDNFNRIFLRGVTMDEYGYLIYERFDGFMFWLANPFYIVFAGTWIRGMIKSQKLRPTFIALLVGILLQLLLLMLHRTFGGWQFGARYMVDGLPFLALPLLLASRKEVSRSAVAIGLFAVAFNLYGAVALMTVIR